MTWLAPDPDPPAIFGSPLVTDTLAALVGGAPAMGVATAAPTGLRAIENGGAYYRPAQGTARDSVNFYNAPEDPQTQRFLLIHEFGHALDARGQFPELVKAVTSVKPNRNSYGATNDREHFAEAFTRGFDAMSQPITDPGVFTRLVDALEKITPGTRHVVDWLRGQPVYSKHPMHLPGIGRALMTTQP